MEGPMERREVFIGGFANSFLEGGDPEAPVLLLLHGAGFGSDAVTCWHGFMPEVAGRYRVLALDFYGHGESAKIAALDRSARRLHELQVIEFCRALQLQPLAMIGSSHGGAVALYCAASGGLAPFKVVDISGAGGHFHRHDGFDVMVNHQPDRSWAEQMASLCKANPTRQDIELRLARSLIPGHIESVAANGLRREIAPDRKELDELCQMIENSGVDLFFIAGSEDPLLEPRWIGEFSRRLPRAKTLVVDGARHEPQHNQPVLMAKSILEFLDC